MAGRCLHLQRFRRKSPRQILQRVVGVPLDDNPRLRCPRSQGDQGNQTGRKIGILGRFVVGRTLCQRTELGQQGVPSANGSGCVVVQLLVFDQLPPDRFRRSARHVPAGDLPAPRVRTRRRRVDRIRYQPCRALPAQRLYLLRDGGLLAEDIRHRGSLLLLPQTHGRADGLRHRSCHQQRYVGRHQAGHRPLRSGGGHRIRKTVAP